MAGTPVVDGDGQAGTTLNLSGFTASQSGVLKAGDYIRVAGSYKSYLVVSDVDSAADGTASVTIHPGLQDELSDGAAVSGAGTFRCALTGDIGEIDVDEVLHYGLQVDLIEVLD